MLKYLIKGIFPFLIKKIMEYNLSVFHKINTIILIY